MLGFVNGTKQFCPDLLEVAGGVIIAHGVGDCIDLLEGDAGLEVLAGTPARVR